MKELEIKKFNNQCLEIRNDIIDILAHAKRGHVGSAFSIVEILNSLYFYILKDDRFILSKGHGCLALYAVLARKGLYQKEDVYSFCTVGSKFGGHPKRGDIPGIEASTGSLGQGLSVGVGMSLALKLQGKSENVFVLLGDGECNEGSVWEAMLSAKKNELSNLIVLIDYNKMQSYGSNEDVCPLEPFAHKWESFGADVYQANLIKDKLALINIFSKIKISKNPKVIICHTVKGMGNSVTENNLNWHHKNNVSDLEVKALRKGLVL
jgi:transketolase